MKDDNCIWAQEYDGWSEYYWDTSCGETFYFPEGTPSENGMKFCPYCGKILVSKEKNLEEDNEDEM